MFWQNFIFMHEALILPKLFLFFFVLCLSFENFVFYWELLDFSSLWLQMYCCLGCLFLKSPRLSVVLTQDFCITWRCRVHSTKLAPLIIFFFYSYWQVDIWIFYREHSFLELGYDLANCFWETSWCNYHCFYIIRVHLGSLSRESFYLSLANIMFLFSGLLKKSDVWNTEAQSSSHHSVLFT